MKLSTKAFMVAVALGVVLGHGRPVVAAESRPHPAPKGEAFPSSYGEVRAQERAELVTPAPRGYKPKFQGRHLSLKLIPRDAKIRAGEDFWYRLELANDGSLPVVVDEYDSFLKRGDRYDSRKWHFSVITPNGAVPPIFFGREEVHLEYPANSRRVVSIPGSEKMTDSEIREFMRAYTEWRREDSSLFVTLQPGETLASRPWQREKTETALMPDAGDATAPSARKFGGFRELWTSFQFDVPGRYEISVQFNNPDPPLPSEAVLAEMEKRGHSRDAVLESRKKWSSGHIGRIQSNSIVLQVER